MTLLKHALRAEHAVFALPPRVLVRDIAISPALPSALLRAFSSVPTWMAAHAKMIAIYDTPFWRAQGLSGDAMSQAGPLAEIHDASPANAATGALFGFLGTPAQTWLRDPGEIREAAIRQLRDLFGPAAASPRDVLWQDWAAEPETATEADMTPPAGHPDYRPPAALRELASERLHFAGTELAPKEGGFIEGALAAAEAVAARLTA